MASGSRSAAASSCSDPGGGAGVRTADAVADGGAADPGCAAVHVGARIAAEAAAGEVLVSSTVRELVAGAGFAFVDRGGRKLEGVPAIIAFAAALPPGAAVFRRRAPVERVAVLLLIPMLAVVPAVSFVARTLC